MKLSLTSLEPMSFNLFIILAYKHQVRTRLHPSYTIAVMPFWIHLKLSGTNEQKIFFSKFNYNEFSNRTRQNYKLKNATKIILFFINYTVYDEEYSVEYFIFRGWG